MSGAFSKRYAVTAPDAVLILPPLCPAWFSSLLVPAPTLSGGSAQGGEVHKHEVYLDDVEANNDSTSILEPVSKLAAILHPGLFQDLLAAAAALKKKDPPTPGKTAGPTDPRSGRYSPYTP
jgi:hypothetical protein